MKDLTTGFIPELKIWVHVKSNSHYMPTFGINIDRCITYSYTRANQVVDGVANKAYCKKDLNI